MGGDCVIAGMHRGAADQRDRSRGDESGCEEMRPAPGPVSFHDLNAPPTQARIIAPDGRKSA